MPSKLPAATIVRKVDQRLATLGPATLTFHYTFFRPKIGGGQFEGNATILSPKVYRLQMPQVDPTRPNVIAGLVWLSDGKHFGQGTISQPPKPASLSSRPRPNPKPLNDWFNNFSLSILSSVGLQANTFTKLLSQAKAAKYSIVTQQRTLRFQGHTILSYRIVMAKNGLRYETVFDGHGFVPVTVTNTLGQQDTTRWSAVRWSLRPKSIDRSVLAFRK